MLIPETDIQKVVMSYLIRWYKKRLISDEEHKKLFYIYIIDDYEIFLGDLDDYEIDEWSQT